MSKKEYILTILNALLDSRPIAKDLKLLLEHDKLNEDTLNILVKIFQKSIKKVYNKIEKVKLNEWLSQIKEIKNQEKKTENEDKISVSRLDNLIRYL